MDRIDEMDTQAIPVHFVYIVHTVHFVYQIVVIFFTALG